MQSRIQRTPAGFLSQLGMKGTGANPSALLDEVRAVVEMGEQLAAGIPLEVETATSPGQNVTGTAAVITIPSTEAWRVVSASGGASGLTAADTIKLALNLIVPGAANGTVIAVSRGEVVVATERVDFGVLFPRPLFLPPGSILACLLQRPPGVGTADLFVRVNFARYLV